MARECPVGRPATSTYQPGTTRGRGSGPSTSGARSGGRGRGYSGRGGAEQSGSGARGHVYAMGAAEAHTTPDVVEGTISVFDCEAHTLMDPGASHSFIATTLVARCTLPQTALDQELVVSTPLGDPVVVRTVIRGCPVLIEDQILEADLIPLDIQDFDIILGMDWLSSYGG